MNLKSQSTAAAELKFEIDSLYVSTAIILSRRFRPHPLDGLLLEACLLHLRIVWDFFHRAPKKATDIVATRFNPKWTLPTAPPQPDGYSKLAKRDAGASHNLSDRSYLQGR